MKNIFRLGVTASLMAAIVFSGCQKSDDDKPSSKKQRHVQSQLSEYTENGFFHQEKTEYKYDANWNRTLVYHTSIADGAEVSSSKEEYKYDDYGREVWHLKTSTENGVATYTEERSQKFDWNGNLIEYQYVSDSKDGSIFTEKIVFKYNKHGDPTERITTNNSESSTNTWEYQYDNKGNITNMEGYVNGVLQGKRTFEYDEQGNVTKEETYNFNISTNEFDLTNKIEYTYDGNTKSFTQEFYSNDGTDTYSVVIVYTDTKREKIKNRKDKTTYSDGTTINNEEKYSYDNKGNVTLREYYTNGILTSKSGYEGNTSFYYSYGDNGEIKNSSKTIYTDSNRDKPLIIENSNHKEEYTYDNDGNEIGYKLYWKGSLKTENKNYVYVGNKLTYTSLMYSDDLITRTSHYTIIYCE